MKSFINKYTREIVLQVADNRFIRGYSGTLMTDSDTFVLIDNNWEEINLEKRMVSIKNNGSNNLG